MRNAPHQTAQRGTGTKYRARTILVLAALAGLGSISEVAAQSSPACASLVQEYWNAIDRRSPARSAPSRASECHYLFAASARDRLPLLARSTDVAALQQLAIDVQPYREPSIAHRALELFSDPSATDEARWFGLVIAAANFSRPAHLRPDLAAHRRDAPGWTEPLIMQCISDPRRGEIRLAPASAAFDTLYADRLREVSRRPNTSPFLRGMLKCLSRQYARITPAVQPGEITARYDCDNRWFLRYTGPEEEVIVEYGPASAPGTVRIAMWSARAEMSEYMPFAADLRVLSRGNTVLVARHGHISCRSKMLRERGEPIAPGLDTLSNWQWRSQPDSTRRPAPPRRTRPPGR